MPHRLKARQEKLQNKRKQTPWREFVKEVCSILPMNYKKYNWIIHKWYNLDRIWGIIPAKEFEKIRNDMTNTLNFWKSFFDNFFLLQKSIQLPALLDFWWNENASYAEAIFSSKNVYLSSIIASCENIMYCLSAIDNSHNCIWSTRIAANCNNIIDSAWITNSYNIFFSKDIHNSSDIRCSNHCIWCHHLYNCNNLENKSYCIDNKQYTKEEYEKEIQKYHYRKKYAHNNTINNMNIFNSQDIENCVYIKDTQRGRNIFMSDHWNEMYDIIISWKWEHYYWTMGVGQYSEHIYCSYNTLKNSHIYYSYFLENCSYCLGCIWLKNKSYCILNKQYTKEERYDKVDEIFTQMEKDWTLWKFFPWTMNPFYFNDTAAYLIDDTFTKEEVEAEGYLRRDEKIKVDILEGAEIVYVENPPQSPFSKGGSEAGKEASNSPSFLKRGSGSDSLDDYQWRKVNGKFYPISEIWNKVPKADSGAERWIDPEILKKVIQDQEGNYYKIVKMEYDFLMKHKLPLPKLHWLERIKLGFKFK